MLCLAEAEFGAESFCLCIGARGHSCGKISPFFTSFICVGLKQKGGSKCKINPFGGLSRIWMSRLPYYCTAYHIWPNLIEQISNVGSLSGELATSGHPPQPSHSDRPRRHLCCRRHLCPGFFTFSLLELYWWISFWHFTSPWIALMDLISFCPFLLLWIAWSLFSRRTQWPAAQAAASQQIRPRTGRRSRFFDGLLTLWGFFNLWGSCLLTPGRSFDCD